MFPTSISTRNGSSACQFRPESLDLNQVMASTEGMVRQLMGGDVDMRIVPAEGLRAVKADAGQIEQSS